MGVQGIGTNPPLPPENGSAQEEYWKLFLKFTGLKSLNSQSMVYLHILLLFIVLWQNELLTC